MAKKSPTQRLARVEDICMGAGFLLMKLQSKYGSNFSEGLSEQVSDCIRDCRQVQQSREQREATAAAKAAP